MSWRRRSARALTAATISIRHYIIVTAAYWAFTLTDGALRMLVLLHFNQLGYTPVQLAFLFLLYEFFGIVTNLVGGWLASRTGLRFTLVARPGAAGVALLGAAALLEPGWSIAVSVAYVMGCQALSGIAKDLTKMSAKSAVKVLVPTGDDSALFKWVAVLTGSKNALKGAGFFVGGLLLSTLGFRGALARDGRRRRWWCLSACWRRCRRRSVRRRRSRRSPASCRTPPGSIGSRWPGWRCSRRAMSGSWSACRSSSPAVLGWSFTQVGGFMAALGDRATAACRALAPSAARAMHRRPGAGPGLASALGLALAAVTALIPLGLRCGLPAAATMLGGLVLFGIVFALNSSVHSYLVLAYSEADRVSLSVGFYYMANAVRPSGRARCCQACLYQWLASRRHSGVPWSSRRSLGWAACSCRRCRRRAPWASAKGDD